MRAHFPAPRCGAVFAATGLVLVGLAAAPSATAGVAVAALLPAAPGGGFFTRIATVPAALNAADPAVDGAVAEISTVTPDGMTVISTDSEGDRLGFFDITDPAAPRALGGVPVGGEPTSVYATGEYVLAVVDTSDGDFMNPSGHVSVLDAESREVLATIDLGGQPDSIDVTTDGSVAAIAIENQRDEEAIPEGGEEGDLPQLPGGGLVLLALDGHPATWSTTAVDLADLAGIDTAEDPEAEYVTISPDDRTVAVTLQENNAVAFVDLATASVTSHFFGGTATVSGIDTSDDDRIALTDTITDVPREPDGIAWIDAEHVATANEGDWKGGTRGWTVFEAATGAVVWDAGNSFDHLAVELGLYPDSRSDAKGSEPENVIAATFDGVPYAFVGSERGNFVAVYDMTVPSSPRLVQALPSTPGPEGLLAVPSRDLLVVSSETDDVEAGIRATVQVYELGATTPSFPSIVSSSDENGPLPWGALGALTADPTDPARVWSASDSSYTPSRLFSIDASATPALVDAALTVTEGGVDASFDIEGLFARPDGGFWAVSEGRTGPENALLLLDEEAAVQRSIALPTAVADGLGSQGFEGVTAVKVDGREIVWTVLQRASSIDPADVARIGRYDVEADSWSFFGYPLTADSGVEGDWNGLSEITLTGAETLAVIERDKLAGPAASLKTIATVPLPTGPGSAVGEDLPMLEKTVAVDALPALTAGRGWTQEKIEGLTVRGDGQVVVVTDNDAVDEVNGETVFATLGTAAALFGAAPAPTPTTSPTDDPTPKPTTAPTGAPTGAPTAAPSSAHTTSPVTRAASGTRPPGVLASTGADVGPIVGIAVLMLALGGGVLAIRRRRSTR